MSDEQKRAAVIKAYPGDRWAEKVRKMPAKQVHSMYMRLLHANKLK